MQTTNLVVEEPVKMKEVGTSGGEREGQAKGSRNGCGKTRLHFLRNESKKNMIAITLGMCGR